MPILDKYVAEVTIVVTLKSEHMGRVAGSYSVTRRAEGFSAPPGESKPSTEAIGVENVIGQALIDATAANRALAAGLRQTEARRLKVGGK